MDMGLFFVCFVFLVFPKVFRKQKSFGKTKNTKEYQRKQQQCSGKPKNKVCQGFRPTLGYGFLCFPEGFLFWLSLMFFGCVKAFGKTKNKKVKPISKGGSETFNNLVFWCFRSFVWFSLVFFCIFGFPEGFLFVF